MRLFNEQRTWAFLFPGIGVKPFGGEKDFYRNFRGAIEPFLDQASELIDVDLSVSLLNNTTSDNDQLSREIFSYAFACGVFQVFREKGFDPSFLAGHSMGIYAALVSSGAISFVDGLAITKQAHVLGRRWCNGKKFGVVVIIGLEREDIRKIVDERELGSVVLANYNNRISGVYVGFRNETEILLVEAEARGAAKTIQLRIDIPFHHMFMGDVAHQFKPFLESLTWHKPIYPLVSALEHNVCSNQEDLIRMTGNNLATPIHWPGVLKKMQALGVTSVIECGCGISLSQHARLIDYAPKHYTLKNLRNRLKY